MLTRGTRCGSKGADGCASTPPRRSRRAASSPAFRARCRAPPGSPARGMAGSRLQLDALRQLWRERILRFDQPAQLNLLSALGIREPDGEKIVLVMAAGLALVFAWLTWQIRREQRPPVNDPVIRAYTRLCRKLASAGLARRPHEGPEAFAARIAVERPEIGLEVQMLCRRYSRLRYGASRGAAAERWFVARARAFKPRRAADRRVAH